MTKCLITFVIFTGMASGTGLSAQTQVRVCARWFELPHSVLTELLGGTAKDGDGLHAEVMSLAKQNRALIVEDNVIVCKSGQKASLESIREEIHPSEYFPPTLPCSFSRANALDFTFCPTAFETNDTGPIIEIAPTVTLPNVVNLEFGGQIVTNLRTDIWMKQKDQLGDASMRMPVYEAWRPTASLTLSSGKFELVTVITPRVQPAAPSASRRILLFVRADILSGS